MGMRLEGQKLENTVNKNIKLNLLGIEDLGFTPEQELAVSKFQKAFVDYQTKEALVNIFVFLMTAATLLLPIILAFTTSNFANLLLLLIYPISTIFMGQIRYSRMNIFLINFITYLILFLLNFYLLNGDFHKMRLYNFLLLKHYLFQQKISFLRFLIDFLQFLHLTQKLLFY